MTFKSMATDTIRIKHDDGKISEPCKASVQKDKIIIFNDQIVIEENDIIIRELGENRQELLSVISTHYQKGIHSMPSHYIVKYNKMKNKKPTNSKSKKIFISHSTKDALLVNKLVSFLRDGLGVPHEAIFCSSVYGLGIPTGEDFIEVMRDGIFEPHLIIALISPSYTESSFCLMELGAAWVQDCPVYPIIVPDINFEFINKTLGTKNGISIKSDNFTLDIAEKIKKCDVELEPKTPKEQKEKFENWEQELSNILDDIPKKQVITKKEFDELTNENNKLKNKIKKQKKLIKQYCSETENEKKEEYLKQLENNTNLSLETTLDRLIDNVEEAQPNGIYKKVFLHLIMDHYGKASQIDWYEDREDFEEAIKRKVIDQDTGQVNWDVSKMQKLSKAIQAVDDFMSDEESSSLIESFERDNLPTETDDLDFWEHHLR